MEIKMTDTTDHTPIDKKPKTPELEPTIAEGTVINGEGANQIKATPPKTKKPKPQKKPRQQSVPLHIENRRKIADQSSLTDLGNSGPFATAEITINSESMRLLLLHNLNDWMKNVADTVPLFNYINRHGPSAKLLAEFLSELKETSTSYIDDHELALNLFVESSNDLESRLKHISKSTTQEKATFVFQQPYFWTVIDLIKSYDDQLYRVECLKIAGCMSPELDDYRINMINKMKATIGAFCGITKIRNNRRANASNVPLNVDRFNRLKERYYREMDIDKEVMVKQTNTDTVVDVDVDVEGVNV